MGKKYPKGRGKLQHDLTNSKDEHASPKEDRQATINFGYLGSLKPSTLDFDSLEL